MADQPQFDPNASYSPASNPPQQGPQQNSQAPAFDPNASYAPAPSLGDRVWNAAKDELGNIVGAPVQMAKTAVSSAVTPPEDASEHIVATVGGPGALLAYRTSKGVVDGAQNMLKAKKGEFQQAKQDLMNAVNEFHNKDYRNAIADTASAAAGITGLTGDPTSVAGRVRDIAQGSKAGGDMVTPITKDLVDLGATALAEKVGEKAPQVADAASSAKTGIGDTVDALLHGEAAAQPDATIALKGAAKNSVAGTDEAGAMRDLIENNASTRTVLEQPIKIAFDDANALYEKIDDAAGTDFKALNEKLSNTEYQIRQLTDTEEDVQKEAALEKSRQGLIDKISAAKEQAIKNGVDPDALDLADKKFTQAQALKDLEAKVFKNSSVVSGNEDFGSPESIDIDSATKQIQKLHDNTKFGSSRLEQALGKGGAEQLLEDMYKAQRYGKSALDKQLFVKRALNIAWKTALPAIGLKELFFH
jgi:hypothetical protein